MQTPIDELENSINHADIFDLCEMLPDASVDMILCDLPYGTTACAWDTVIPFEPMWKAFKRIINPRGAIVLTASQPFTSALVMSNPKMFRCEWIWDKVLIANFASAKIQPLRCHESVLIFSEESTVYYPQLTPIGKPFGKKSKTNSESMGNPGMDYQMGVGYPKTIIRYPRPNNLTGGGLHPTQKPVDLFRYLIRTYTQPNELVFDPCVGSGTTAIAAREEGRRYIVGDSSAEYVQVARNRLAQPYTPSFMHLLENE